MLHSISEGVYGGETLLTWDEPRRTVRFIISTGGYITIGTLELKEGKFITHEDVKGDANGMTRTRNKRDSP